MDELDRFALVESYHRNAGISQHEAARNLTRHRRKSGRARRSVPVRNTLEHQINERIDRHEAIHAVASVLIEFISDVVRGSSAQFDPKRPVLHRAGRADGESWRKGSGIPSGGRRSNRSRRETRSPVVCQFRCSSPCAGPSRYPA